MFYGLLAVGILAVVSIWSLIYSNLSKDHKSSQCVIENCHGLEISCGPKAPEFCTFEYAPGDICRQYASCRVVAGECQLVETAEFSSCKSCFENCWKDFSEDPIELFACESECEE